MQQHNWRSTAVEPTTNKPHKQAHATGCAHLQLEVLRCNAPLRHLALLSSLQLRLRAQRLTNRTANTAALLTHMNATVLRHDWRSTAVTQTTKTHTQASACKKCTHLQLEVLRCNTALRHLPLLPLLHLRLRALCVLVAAAACCIATWQEPDAVHAAQPGRRHKLRSGAAGICKSRTAGRIQQQEHPIIITIQCATRF
jgi:hypothetical protein